MVAPCCNRCYEKYIEKDEITIDRNFLDKEFGKHSTIKIEESEDKAFVEFAKKKKLPIPTNSFVCIEDKKIKLCMCTCHVKDIAVRH